MVILCPALDYYIDTKECSECESKCDNEPVKGSKEYRQEAELALMDIYNLLYPNACYTGISQAHQMIREKLKQHTTADMRLSNARPN